MKEEVIRRITIELARMAMADLSEIDILTLQPHAADPFFNAIATGMSTAVKVQLEEVSKMAHEMLSPAAAALVDGWCCAKRVEAGLPPELPDWYKAGDRDR